MLPVVRGETETIRRIVLYSVALVAATAAPFATGTLGIEYLVAALGLGGGFLYLALRLRGNPTRRRALLLFHYSLLYLAALFAAAALTAGL